MGSIEENKNTRFVLSDMQCNVLPQHSVCSASEIVPHTKQSHFSVWKGMFFSTFRFDRLLLLSATELYSAHKMPNNKQNDWTNWKITIYLIQSLNDFKSISIGMEYVYETKLTVKGKPVKNGSKHKIAENENTINVNQSGIQCNGWKYRVIRQRSNLVYEIFQLNIIISFCIFGLELLYELFLLSK